MPAPRKKRAFFVVAFGLLGATAFFFFPSVGAVPHAEAGTRTKTIVWFMGQTFGSQVASGATTTFNFTINIPDIAPTAQPIRSAYIHYNANKYGTTDVSALTTTIFKQGGAVQTLNGPVSPALDNTGETNIWGWRTDATSAMRNIIGNASGSYAMSYTMKITGPTRSGESARLYITYDFDPWAQTQVNTVYQHVYSSSTQLSSAIVTSPTFNFNLPETGATTTASVGASSTNHFWVEFRQFSNMSANLSTSSFGWDSESTSSVPLNLLDSGRGVLALMQPKTEGASPSSDHTVKMHTQLPTGLSDAPNAIAVATYTYDFDSSTKFRKTLQVLLMQSTAASTSIQINTTSTINIPESSPSSTDAFLFGRSVFMVAASPGVSATTTTNGCTFLSPQAVTIGTLQTDTTGYPTIVWQPTSTGMSFNTAGDKTVCSAFSTSANASLRGLMLFWSYDYAKQTTAGSRFNQNVSLLGVATTTLISGATTTMNIDASATDASSTAQASWLNVEYDDSSTAATQGNPQIINAGTTDPTPKYSFANTDENGYGETFATSSAGLASSVTSTIRCSQKCIADASYNVWFQTEIAPASTTQIHYHWRNDDGSETAATAAASEDVSTSTTKGTIYRLRFEVSNEGDAQSSLALRLEYQQATTTGVWTELATSTAGSAHWQMASSSQVTHGVSTTNIATSTGGTTDENFTFIAATVVATTTTNRAATTTIGGTQFTEVEYAIKATTNSVTDATYYFRMTNASTVLDVYSIFASSTVVGGAATSSPTVSSVLLNHGNPITLTSGATSSIDINYTITDSDGCDDITVALTTSTAWRWGVAATCSTPQPTTNNLNCYVNVTHVTSTCSANSINVTDTVQIYYFAQATDSSSSFASDHWEAYALAADAGNATGSATSSAVELNTLLALDIGTSTVNYGTMSASSTSGATNQTTSVRNAGNASTSLQISGTALVMGSYSIPTSSQRYATSSFTFGGNEQVLSNATTTVSAFLLTSPTSTTRVSSLMFWGIEVPAGRPTGTYSGTNTFTAVFSP